MDKWLKLHAKELMPDALLRLSFMRCYDLKEDIGRFPAESFETDEARKFLIYLLICDISEIWKINASKPLKIIAIPGSSAKIVKRHFSSAKLVDAGLHLYEHSPDFLRWLLDRMIADDFRGGIVLVEKRLAEIGATDEGRFAL